MAIQIPVAHSISVVQNGRTQRSWREHLKTLAFGSIAICICALVIRFAPSDEVVLTSTVPLSTHQAAVMEIVKNLTDTNATEITDPSLISSSTGIFPFSNEEWDAWESTHFPAECIPTSSNELAPDGKIVPADIGPDCSQMKALNKKQTVLASVLSKAEQTPQLTSTTLHDLSAAVSQLKAETDKEEDVMKQILHLSAMKIKKLQRLRIPGKQGPNQAQ